MKLPRIQFEGKTLKVRDGRMVKDFLDFCASMWYWYIVLFVGIAIGFGWEYIKRGF